MFWFFLHLPNGFSEIYHLSRICFTEWTTRQTRVGIVQRLTYSICTLTSVYDFHWHFAYTPQSAERSISITNDNTRSSSEELKYIKYGCHSHWWHEVHIRTIWSVKDENYFRHILHVVHVGSSRESGSIPGSSALGLAPWRWDCLTERL